jgi:hypothetical protein
MANDFYIQEEDSTDWALLEEELHEWAVIQDVAAIIKLRGYNYVLSAVMDIVDNS